MEGGSVVMVEGDGLVEGSGVVVVGVGGVVEGVGVVEGSGVVVEGGDVVVVWWRGVGNGMMVWW